MRQTRLVASLIAVLAAAFAGCGKHATEPPPVTAPGVPRLIATEPPARSVLVLYDSQVWGQFDRALDPATIGTQSVFLKLDGQRIPITVSYEAAARKIRLTPATALLLQRTYTVEFTPTIHSEDGVPLASNVYYQFTTNSLRRILYDTPSPGALAGPVAMLAWGGSQGPVGEIRFEVYAGTDSAQVRQRAMPPLHNHVFTRFLPTAAWPRGSRVYWAVTGENLNTHERMDGEVSWFDVVGTNLTEESILLRARDHGSKNITQTTQYCGSPDLPCGGTFNGGIRWNLAPLPADARIVSATVGLAAKANGMFPSTQPTLWMAQNDWTTCAVNAPGPPYAEVSGLLSTGAPTDTIRVEFTSDRLAAFFEAQLHRDVYAFGTLIRANSQVTYHSPLSNDPAKIPWALIRYVRPSPGSAR